MMLAAAHALGAGAERVGVAAAALLAAVFVLGRAPRVSASVRALAALGVLVMTPVLLVADIWNTSQLQHLRHHPLQAGAAIAVGALALGVLAIVLHHRPRLTPVLAIAALPFRLPISSGGSTSNLLIPLYLVVGAGTLAYLVPRLRAASPAARRLTPADERAPEASVGTLEWLLVASLLLYALQAAYSSDFHKGLENLVFFYVPFALLFGLLRRVAWTQRLLLVCLGVAVAEALLFAGIGFIEYATKHLLLNPKVVQANQYDNYFRVNSLFFDPNIYGRFLALVMLMVTTVVLWTRRRRDGLVGAAVLAWLLGGLVTSFSQSSIAALLLGLAVLAAQRWNLRDTALVALTVLGLALAVVIFAPSGTHLGVSGSKSADNATSGRYSLITRGLSLFADRPLQGYGPGSFPLEYRRHNRRADAAAATSASHTIPVTVAAEQGLIGLLLYLALLVVALRRLFGDGPLSPARLALAGCFLALVLHTLAYADFLEDPVTWTLLGIGSALVSAGPGPGRWPRRGGLAGSGRGPAAPATAASP